MHIPHGTTHSWGVTTGVNEYLFQVQALSEGLVQKEKLRSTKTSTKET